jgi:hypothetical protein
VQDPNPEPDLDPYRNVTDLVHWFKSVYFSLQGWAALGTKMKEWALIAGKASVAVILLMGLIPFLFGVLLDLVVLTPVRVPLHQSPIYFLWQVW